MKQDEAATRSLSTVDRLYQIRMSPYDLRIARASLLQAELIADLLIRANDDLRRVFGFVGRGIGALARRNKVSPLAPKWRAPS
jgi:hypothetical protein